MRRYRLTRAPRALRWRGVQLDNVALVPASLLPFKAEWQRIANELPAGSVLVWLPESAPRHRRVAERVVSCLRQQGRHVAVLDKLQPGGL